MKTPETPKKTFQDVVSKAQAKLDIEKNPEKKRELSEILMVSETELAKQKSTVELAKFANQIESDEAMPARYEILA